MDATSVIKIRNAAVENLYSEAVSLLNAAITGTKVKAERFAETMKRLNEYRTIAKTQPPTSEE